MFDLESLKERLNSLGYEVSAADDFALTFSLGKVKSSVLNNINHSEIPSDLERIAIDMAVGEFLLVIKTFSPEKIQKLDLDYAVKQIQVGDTSTVFATGEASSSPEQRLNAFIDHLLHAGKDQFNCFRRVRW